MNQINYSPKECIFLFVLMKDRVLLFHRIMKRQDINLFCFYVPCMTTGNKYCLHHELIICRIANCYFICAR